MANTGNTQQQIDYGAAANDGQGDPLRTAFIKTDDNFDAIWATGPVGSNITIVNNTVQSNNVNGNIVLRPNGVGMIQANAAVIPNATNLRDLGTADLRFRAAYIGTGGLDAAGNITGDYILGNGAFITGISGGDYSNANVANYLPTYSGNISAGNVILSGRLLPSANNVSNIGSGVSRLDSLFVGNIFGTTVINPTAGGVLTVQGQLAVANVITGQIINEFPLYIQTSNGGTWEFAGNILRGPQGGSWASDAATSYFNSPANGFLNLTSLQNGNVVSELFMEHSFIRFFIDNGIDATWQMLADGRTEFPSYTFPYLDGNAGEVLKTDGAGNLAWTTDSSDYGNANVATLLSAFGSNSIVTTGNVSANYFVGNGSLLTGISSGIQSSIANGTSNVDIATANGNATITANAVTYTFGTNSTLTLPGGSQLRPLGANLDIIAGTGSYVNLITSDESSSMGVDNGGGYIVTAGGTWNFDTTGNLTAPGNVSAVGNITGNNINASTSFGLPVYANATVRDSAIASPQPGMMVFVSGTGLQVRGATAWNTVAGTAT